MILLVTLLAAWLINRDIIGSLRRLKAAMENLAKGGPSTEVAGTERRDEMGGMAGAVLVFKDNMVKAEHICGRTASRNENGRRAAKREALLAMAETIEGEARHALTEISRRTHAMAEAANGMSRIGNAHRTVRAKARRAQPCRLWPTPRPWPARPSSLPPRSARSAAR